MRRVQTQFQKRPQSADAHFLEARIYATERAWDRVEDALLTALDLNPNFSSAYDLLISVYITAGKLHEAIDKLQGILAKSPGDKRGLMTSAMIYEQLNDFAKAHDAYEKLLAITPDFVPALNNLAYLYTDRLNQADKSYELARKARKLRPADAAVADTLGWIFYKRGDYQQALTLLQESAGKLSDNAEIQFHLGMANYMMGQTGAARTAFERAAATAADFPGKEESKRRLALLGASSATSNVLPVDDLKTLVNEHPNDVLAWERLADSYEKQGALAEAAAAYQEAVRLNPKLLSATLKLAHLNAGALQNKDRAMVFAKKARELAPTDPKIAALLGRIAYQAGNFTWAYGLLQEGARRLTDDAAILYDYAWAAYSIGKMDEAQQAMQIVLKVAVDSPTKDDAKLFLAMTALDPNSRDLTRTESEVQKRLKENPAYVSALMTQAAIRIQRGERRAAAGNYIEVLQRYPDFAPAQKYLASLYAEDPASLDKAYGLAVKARKTLLDDPELTRILAEISYKKNEFAYALQLLEESARKKTLDAKALYYLGMSRLQAKQDLQGREAINQALAAGLQEPLTAEAKRTITQLQ